ncbi:MAG: hypothetical protein ACK4MR_01430, partial [Erythrobacter cryptus]
DQSFVRDMLHDADDMAIVEGVLGLAAAFRTGVIAEGVETLDDMPKSAVAMALVERIAAAFRAEAAE